MQSLIRQRAMNIKTKCKQIAELKQKKSMSLPRKSLIHANFSNERLNGVLKTSQNASPVSHSSVQTKHRKTFSFVISPTQKIPKNVLLSFDDFVSSRNNFRKLLKHSSIKGSNKMRTQATVMGLFPSRSPNGRFPTQIDDPTFQMRKCLQLSTQSTIRKSYHQKFEKTRMIFHEQEKMKKIDKINRIYERRNNIFNKISKSGDLNQMVKARQSSKYTPWIKNFNQRNQIYEVSENGSDAQATLNVKKGTDS